jgi:5'-nucleotidase (lipoprotein e(P4) family)
MGGESMIQLVFKIALIVWVHIVLAGCQANMSTKLPLKTNESDVKAQQANKQEVSSLKIASWNAEHLAYPISTGCKPRTTAEIASMQAYVNEIDADIVALQELGSESAARLLFPETEWNIVMSARADSESYVCRGNGYQSTQQKVAFVYKKSVRLSQVTQVSELSLGNPGLRFGLMITIDTANGPVDLLNLHLKSGCFVDDFQRSDSPACEVFAKQAAILDAWVEQKEASLRQFVILGDFNHRISAPYNRLTQNLRSNSEQMDSSLQIATEKLIGCHPRYPAPIDHIIVGGMNANVSIKNAKFHLFEGADETSMLSDHCAVSIELESKPSSLLFDLSSAVKWQTQSKEYQYITRAIYQEASAKLLRQVKPTMPFVVVMDIDETILDNSPYQAMLDSSKQTYSTKTWNAWVQSEQAKLVPGSDKFIETVIAHGGKLALITNREKSLDGHTWANLLSVNLPISQENSCLIGRMAEDTQSIDGKYIVNDKDLRRQQIINGDADCYAPTGKKLTQWQQPHKILMQVGDNIQDIQGVDQQTINIQELLKLFGDTVILLPNPMYGSW